MIRYSYYFIREVYGSNPYVSTWLRYSGFVVLYPVGVASELACCFMALPLLRVRAAGPARVPGAARPRRLRASP